MSTDPVPSVTRGDITLQPAYFTSSLFVNPLREDVARLVQTYADAYLHYKGQQTVGEIAGGHEGIHRQGANSRGASPAEQPALGNDEEQPHMTNPRTVYREQETQHADSIASAATVGITVENQEILVCAMDTPMESDGLTVNATSAPSTSQTEPALMFLAGTGTHPQPFVLFKELWRRQGWCWFHFKVFDGRARESFINVVLRLFSEYFVSDTNPLAQVVALFGMYTFFTTQPSLPLTPASTSVPPMQLPGPVLHSVKHIALPYDTYTHLLNLPIELTASQLAPLTPYVIYLLSTLLERQAFHILPASSLKTQQPLPREWFIEDTEVQNQEISSVAAGSGEQTKAPKKKGRPTKRERVKKAKDALGHLDRWVDKNTYTYPDAPNGEEASSSGQSQPSAPASTSRGKRTTHTLISHPPKASLAIYTIQKNEYLDAIDPSQSARLHHARRLRTTSATPDLAGSGSSNDVGSPERQREQEALRRANEAMLTRLKKIDEMAAEQGLEVGGEGGEMTGLSRVERAVREMREGVGGGGRGGILRLLEGAGVGEGSSHSITSADVAMR